VCLISIRWRVEILDTCSIDRLLVAFDVIRSVDEVVSSEGDPEMVCLTTHEY